MSRKVLVVLLILTNCLWLWSWREQMRVVRVIDGDTFVLKTGDRVRLSGLDAPELNTCYADQAKNELEKLVLNRIVELDGDKRDGFGRKLGVVTVGSINVNLELIKSGWAKAENSEYKNIGEEVERNKKGIFAGTCKADGSCAILGNIDQNTGKKYYHLPDCRSYNTVKIRLERGEKKFCSEVEAKNAGFILAPDCNK